MNNTERETFLEMLKKSNSISHNMITDNVAVGDHMSDYSDFDIIVNINFPANNVDYNNILVGTTNENKKIYLVGMFDNPNENLTMYLDKLIPELMKECDKKILFHCAAGISRYFTDEIRKVIFISFADEISASFAIAYLGKVMNMNYIDTYNMVKAKRGKINPNNGFVEALKEYLQ